MPDTTLDSRGAHATDVRSAGTRPITSPPIAHTDNATLDAMWRPRVCSTHDSPFSLCLLPMHAAVSLTQPPSPSHSSPPSHAHSSRFCGPGRDHRWLGTPANTSRSAESPPPPSDVLPLLRPSWITDGYARKTREPLAARGESCAMKCGWAGAQMRRPAGSGGGARARAPGRGGSRRGP